MSLHVTPEIERNRFRHGRPASTRAAGANGAFYVQCPGRGWLMIVISNGGGWEHVSVTVRNRCPVWEEMDWVKQQFWDEGDTVIQYHVPVSDHVNVHPFCLHLWRQIGKTMPRPPAWMVGPTRNLKFNKGTDPLVFLEEGT